MSSVTKWCRIYIHEHIVTVNSFEYIVIYSPIHIHTYRHIEIFSHIHMYRCVCLYIQGESDKLSSKLGKSRNNADIPFYHIYTYQNCMKISRNTID